MENSTRPPAEAPQVMAPRPPGKPDRNTAGWIVGGVALCLVLLIMTFFCGTCFMMTVMFRGATDRGEGVALIEVHGVLSASGGGQGLFEWGVSSDSLVEQLHEARKDDGMKAVLLRIDSPGGTPAAAEEVYGEIERTAREKPVVVSIGDIGASGAYYIASAADLIYALPDSDVGSIGVILQIPNIEELNEKIGVSYTTLTEGEYKDIGSPYKPVTAEEQAIFQEQMRVAYDNFIKDVAKGRDMEEARVRDLANGLTWPGVEALEMGLVDELGNYRDAARKAGSMGGIEGEVRLVRMAGGGEFELLSEFITALQDLAKSINLLRGDGSTDEVVPPQKR